MKSSIFPHRRWGAVPARMLTALLLLLGTHTGFYAQSSVIPIEPGKLLHLRLLDYRFGRTVDQDATPRRENSADTDVELVYERVGEEGRGTRYLIGWGLNGFQSRSQSDNGQVARFNFLQNSFRIGVGKSQTARYKRLVLRGGADAYLQFSPGTKTLAEAEDALGGLLTREKADYPSVVQVAVRPFIGLGFQLSERFSLGLEYHMTAGVSTTLGAFQTESRVLEQTRDREIKETKLSLFAQNSTLPIINLNYRF